MSYMADDIILHIANIPPYKGKEALREPFTDYIKNRLLSTTKESTKIEVSKEGDLAFDIGTSVAVVKGLQGPKEVHQKYLDVWKKMSGEWKCVASSWSSSERE
jgi:ketosteroid isomerase-like protein